MSKIITSHILELPDNRGKAQVGDTVCGIWFDEGRWRRFTIEKLNTDIDGGMNLGFSEDGNTFDIGLADHVVVLK